MLCHFPLESHIKEPNKRSSKSHSQSTYWFSLSVVWLTLSGLKYMQNPIAVFGDKVKSALVWGCKRIYHRDIFFKQQANQERCGGCLPNPRRTHATHTDCHVWCLGLFDTLLPKGLRYITDDKIVLDIRLQARNLTHDFHSITIWYFHKVDHD